MKPIVLIAAASLTLAACAQSPDSIAARSVSPALYSGMTCPQINAEALRINARLADLTGRQQSAASSDAAMTAVTLVLFWPAAFFVGHTDHSADIAQLRGEAEALTAAARSRGC